jgi:hypothetical protein
MWLLTRAVGKTLRELPSRQVIGVERGSPSAHRRLCGVIEAAFIFGGCAATPVFLPHKSRYIVDIGLGQSVDLTAIAGPGPTVIFQTLHVMRGVPLRPPPD